MAGRARRITGVVEDWSKWGLQKWKPRHAHCPKCNACLKSPEQERLHKCALARMPDPDLRPPRPRRSGAPFWPKGRPGKKRQRTVDFPRTICGIPLAKVQRLADNRAGRTLTAWQAKAAKEYLEIRLRNMGLSERAGEPDRPVIDADESAAFTSSIWRIDKNTGARTLIGTHVHVPKKVIETVTSHEWAVAARDGEGLDDSHTDEENTTEYEAPRGDDETTDID